MKKWKRVLIVGMCTLILSFTVMSTYQKANEVKALIGVDDALILIALLAGFGIVAGSYVYGNNAQELYDELEEGYDSTRFTLLEGGGGNPDDPEDDDDNINDENGDGKVDAKDIPKFSMLMDTYSLNREIKFTASIIACLAPVIYKWYQGKQHVLSGVDVVKGLETHPEYSSNLFPNYVIRFHLGILSPRDKIGYTDLYFVPPGSTFYFSDTGTAFIIYSPSGFPIVQKYYYTGDSLANYDGTWTHYDFAGLSSSKMLIDTGALLKPPSRGSHYIRTNMHVYHTEEDAKKALEKKELIWVTPELQDTFKNNGEFKRLPIRDPSKAYGIPTQQALQDLDNDMMDNNLTDDDRNNLVNNFINNLQNPSNKPAPGTQPDSPTNPDPDNPTNPDPDNPTNPDPDNPTNPDPDNPTVPDSSLGNFVADLKTLFPFCIPFDLIHAFTVLVSDGVAPVYKIPFKFDYASFHVEQSWEIDMSDYESVVVVFRLLETLAFIIVLIVATRALIKG